MIPGSSRANVFTKRSGSAVSTTSAASAAGAISDEEFRAAFESVPEIRVGSIKELISECQKHATILENPDTDWRVRFKSLQALRGLIKHEIDGFSTFAEQAYQFVSNALAISVKDLRSQVCREACITVAYYCVKLQMHFWKVAEAILPIALNLCQNSAKIMASSACNVNIYIAKHIHHPKILAIVLSHISSKAKEIRRMVITLVKNIITDWEASLLEKHMPELSQTIKVALSDADPEVRATARQAYDNLDTSFPQSAERLFKSLEPAKQRMLAGRTSTASSTHSVNSERENLPNPNRGLYNMQNAFLSKRSTSDLNHAVRKLNLSAQKVVHRPNIVRSGRPQASPVVPPKPAITTAPLAKKTLPIVTSAARPTKPAANTPALPNSSKSSSQPGSRSNSPSRIRQHQNQNTRPNLGVGGQKTAAEHHHHQQNQNIPPPQSLNGQPITKTPMRTGIRPNVIRTNTRNLNGSSPNTPAFATNLEFTPQSGESPQDDFYGLSSKQEAVLLRINSSEKYSDSDMGKYSLTSTAKGRSFDGTADAFKWAYANPEQMANDQVKQSAYIDDICDHLERYKDGSRSDEKEVEGALNSLSAMIRGGGITLWDQYFTPILSALLHMTSSQCLHTTKLAALVALKDLCTAQPKRLVSKTDLVLLKILNAHECDDASVVRAAEDCGAALVQHLSTNTSLNYLQSVIDDEHSKFHQLAGAIKMLGCVLNKIAPEEVQKLLPIIVPRLLRCYENSQSMVRRASIICLVAITNTIGIDHLKPHLNAPTVKLVEVYRERMARKEASGASSCS